MVKLKYCASDPLPIREVITSTNLDEMFSVMTKIINTSFVNNAFPETEKVAIVKPVVKNNMDTQSLNCFRPLSNLTF